MKKILSILIAVMLIISVSVTASALDSGEIDFAQAARIEIGDVNTDTDLNSNDLVQLRKVLLFDLDVVNSDAIDINSDGKINLIDLVRLKKKMAGYVTSQFNSQADELKSDIISAEGNPPSTGLLERTLYVSTSGRDEASGTYSDPLSYEDFIARNPINGTEGWFEEKNIKVVLFKRGDVFRGNFIVESGVYYGAYGSGAKPEIYGSAQNYSNADWSQEGNIYSIPLSVNYDAGLIVFNEGEKVGFKRASLEDVSSEYDFYHDLEAGVLYVCLSKAPSEYSSIEIGTNKKIINILSNATDITIENLSLKYTGAHGIYAADNTSNITVRNCEIAYVGGSYMVDYDDGTTRYGNAIEFWKGCNNILVENNWIYQIYDSGITHQGSGSYTAKNITFQKNLIEYCGLGSIEYWLWYDVSASDYNSAENVTYADNIMRFAGYGWGGEQREDRESSSHIYGGGNNHNNITGFKISGNILDLSTGDLLNITSRNHTYPELSGNIYAQTTNAKLGTFSTSTDNLFDVFADRTVKNVFGDESARVYGY